MFLSVDWALMTDIIPKASAGSVHGPEQRGHRAPRRRSRCSSPAFVIDGVNSAAGLGTGPRVAFIVGVAFYVLAALLLRPVDPTRHEDEAIEAVAA